jgi:four helix bundle protein
MNLEQLMVYRKSMEIGEEVYAMVNKWPPFDKYTLGSQLVKSADSMSGNIAEGYGRYHFKENKLFCFYSRGSMFETDCWIRKAEQRKLIPASDASRIYMELESNKRLLNGYINSIGTRKDGQ